MHVFVWLGNGLILVSALIGIASVAVHTQAPWRKSVMGRHLMVYFIITTVILVLSAIKSFLSVDPEWFSTLRLLVFILLPIAMTHRLILQIKAHRLNQQDSTPPEGFPRSREPV